MPKPLPSDSTLSSPLEFLSWHGTRQDQFFFVTEYWKFWMGLQCLAQWNVPQLAQWLHWTTWLPWRPSHCCLWQQQQAGQFCLPPGMPLESAMGLQIGGSDNEAFDGKTNLFPIYSALKAGLTSATSVRLVRIHFLAENIIADGVCHSHSQCTILGLPRDDPWVLYVRKGAFQINFTTTKSQQQNSKYFTNIFKLSKLFMQQAKNHLCPKHPVLKLTGRWE